MSRNSHSTVLFCIFAVLASACPSTGETPAPGAPGDAGAGTETTSDNQLGAAGVRANGAAGSRAAAGSGGTRQSSSAGRGSSAAGSGGAGPAQGGSAAAGGGAADDDAGVAGAAGSGPSPAGKCIVGGCSNQLCTDAASGPVVSTCEWREAYGCYRTATCTRQSSGQCGWAQTPELTQCLQAAGQP